MNRRLSRVGAVLAVVAIALVLPWPLSPYFRELVNIALGWAVVVIGLNFVLGYAGQISLAQAAFWGIGAYTSALVTTNLHLPVYVAFVVAIAVAGAAGVVLGVPTLKLRGHYLAMATIGFGIIVNLVMVHWRNVTRGTDGIPGIPSLVIGPWSLVHEEQKYYPLLAAFAVFAFIAHRVRHSRLGRAFVAVRENEMAGEVLGIDTTRYKIAAFALCAAFAGAAGSMYAHTSNFISPDSFTFDQSVQFLAMLVLGGSGSIVGASLGAFLLTFVPEWLRFVPFLGSSGYLAVYGAAIMLGMVFLPGGLVSFFQRSARTPEKLRAAAGGGALPFAVPTATSSQLLLETRGLTKAFGGLKAVARLDLRVRSGEIHALIGPNGSGKTTTLNVLNGIYAATEGTILLGGRQVTRMAPHARAALGMARTFQNIRLFGDLSVLENVLIGMHRRVGFDPLGVSVRGRGSASQRAQVDEARHLLEFVGLSGMVSSTARNLPYGAQRLLEIARALASHPQLLLLDEPAAGLNPAETENLIHLLRRIREAGVTLLLIEHDMNLVMSISDSITVLNFGEKIAEGPPHVIAHDARVIEAYLGRDEDEGVSAERAEQEPIHA